MINIKRKLSPVVNYYFREREREREIKERSSYYMFINVAWCMMHVFR